MCNSWLARRCSFYFFYILLTIVSMTSTAHAGYYELGLSGNYRRFFVDRENYSEMESYTSSMAYYFWTSSAVEISYTKGRSKTTTITQTQLVDFELLGFDFVLTFGDKESTLVPYFKLGAAHQKKKITTMVTNTEPFSTQIQGVSPSAGLGFKLAITETLGIRVGVEGWTSPLNQPNTSNSYDLAGRAGLTWMF